MKEITDVCEHCGSLNISGLLFCDNCGKGLSRNFAAYYKKATIKGLKYLILSGVSFLAFVLYYSFGDFEGIVPYFFAALFLAAIVMLVNGVTAMVGRKKFRYRDSAELTMTETPVGETADYLSDAELIARLSVLHAKTVRYIVGGFVSLPLAAVFIIAGGNERFTVPTGIACVLLLVFGVCVVRGSVASDTSKKMFKLNVVQGALAELVEGCVYNAKMSISRERIETTGLIHGWNTFAGNDYLRGMYQGHEIELSDIHLTEVHEERNGEDSNTVTTTIFSGQWLTCRLDKKLPASVILRESGGKGNAETENIAFNRKYQIETEDPHYMFYVLTPHFMEYIVTADEKADARTFFCFAGDRVHIALHNKHDAFEIPTYEFTENFVTTAREKIKEEMKYITDILDEVLRNEYLF